MPFTHLMATLAKNVLCIPATWQVQYHVKDCSAQHYNVNKKRWLLECQHAHLPAEPDEKR